MNFQENFNSFINGFSVFLTGVVMVFIALLILIVLIKIVGMVVARLEGKKETPVIKEVVEEVKVVKPAEKVQDDLELIAVITATIAASLGTTSDQLVVRSLRKVNRRSR